MVATEQVTKRRWRYLMRREGGRGQTSLKVLPVCGHVEQPREVVVCGVVHVHMQVPVLVMNAYNSTKLHHKLI